MTSKKKKTAAGAGTKLKGPKARDNFPDVPDNHSPRKLHRSKAGR
jgi:hypothetical protein